MESWTPIKINEKYNSKKYKARIQVKRYCHSTAKNNTVQMSLKSVRSTFLTAVVDHTEASLPQYCLQSQNATKLPKMLDHFVRIMCQCDLSVTSIMQYLRKDNGSIIKISLRCSNKETRCRSKISESIKFALSSKDNGSSSRLQEIA